jgi:molecular chaperone DnaK
MKRFAVGIDLGTTNSAIACIDPHRRPAVIKNAQGERTTPSVVFFPPDPDEDVLVGTAAKRMRAGCPERTVVCVKRQMGNPHYRFKWSEDDEADPAQLSSLILGALIRDGERRLDGKIDRAVITVPAYFHDLERNRTKEAGRLAGLESVALINEPTAAAQAWAYEAGEDARGACVMVYDLGGGTFDVTVLRDEGGGSFLVVSTDGDPLLGGRDFDIALLRYFIEQFQAKHGIEPGEEDGSIFEWEERAEDAKKQLCRGERCASISSGGCSRI